MQTNKNDTELESKKKDKITLNKYSENSLIK